MVAVPHDSSHVALYALLMGSEYLHVHEGLEFRNPKNPFVCLKKEISLCSYSGDGIGTLNQSCSREGFGFLGMVNVGKYSIHGTYGS